MKTKIATYLLLLALLFASACSFPTTQPMGGKNTDGSGPASNQLTELNRDLFSSYSAKFVVQFDGTSSWRYQLHTRKAGGLREVNLHIEGLDQAANPGDVRLVTDGTTSWMIGPGTEEECVQFPNNEGMDPTLLYPEKLLPAKELSALLVLAGEENSGGIPSLHYAGSANAAGRWTDARVDVWQDKASKGLLRFTMQASGTDPFFGKGEGKLTADYQAAALDVPAIEPVQGCAISVPLPDSAAKLVRLPGLVSFESAAGMVELRGFFQAQLPQSGWTEKEPPEEAEGVVVLSYQRNAEAVEIQIETAPRGGAKVKLIFLGE